jgi:hypothetical protein
MAVFGVPITLAAKPNIGDAAPWFTISTEARAAIHSMDEFDVSMDGERFLVPIVTSCEKAEFVVIQNWEAEMQRGKVNRPGTIDGLPRSHAC